MRATESTDESLELDFSAMSKDFFLSEGQVQVDSIWHQRFIELQKLRFLDDNWDGEGAEPVNHELLELATIYLHRTFITKELPPPTRITLSQDGEIIFEWQLSDTRYLEAVFAEPDTVEWMSDIEGINNQWEDVLAVSNSMPEWEDALSDPEEESSYLWQDYQVA